MKKKRTALVHCEMEMDRIGLMHLAQTLPFPLNLCFLDLSESGIRQNLAKRPDLIILNMGESEDNYNLPQKIKLFAPNIPLLFLTPPIPDSYIYFLRSVMVDRILQKPFSEHEFETVLCELLKPS